MRRVNSSTENGLKSGGLVLLQRLSLMAAVSLFVFCGAVKAQQQADDTQTVEVCAVQLLTGGYGYSFSGFIGPFATTTTFLLGEGRVRSVRLPTFTCPR